MKITFLGVGEGFDEDYTHTCMLIEAAGRRMLVDCGATAPPSVWHKSQRPDYLDGLESAKIAVSMVLGGSEHGSVYKYLEGFRRRKR